MCRAALPVLPYEHFSASVPLDAHPLFKAVTVLFFPQRSVVWGKESKVRDWMQRRVDKGFWKDGSFCRAVSQGVVLWCVVIDVMKCGLRMKCFSTDIFMLTWR